MPRRGSYKRQKATQTRLDVAFFHLYEICDSKFCVLF
jgi:hypothetical protein